MTEARKGREQCPREMVLPTNVSDAVLRVCEDAYHVQMLCRATVRVGYGKE